MENSTKLVDAFRRFFVTAVIYVNYIFLLKLCDIINYVLNTLIFTRTLHSSENNTQLGRILLRRKISTFQTSSPMDFLCLFSSRVQPEYVLRPNISLYCVTTNEAIFVETPLNVNIYSSDENPFLYLAQYNRGRNVIKMAIHTFHTLADKIGDPPVPVIWLSNIGRCGSTMLCQVFERVPGTLVMSEPDAPLKLCDMQSLNKVSDKDYDNIVRSMVRVLCKPYPATERIVIKTRSVCASLMMPLSELFPQHVHQIFMYRDNLDAIASWGPSMGVTPYGTLLRACADNEMLLFLVPFFRKQFRFEIQCKLKTVPEIPLTNTYEQIVHMWANFMVLARDALSRDPNILPLRYEDIVSNPRETIKKIFQTLGLDLKHMDRAITALNRDSQRGSAISGKELRNDPRRQISVANRIIADSILSSYNLPLMGEKFTLKQ